jgi:hypothetical protein
MKKLSLHLDDLLVESFTTTAAVRERGTVRGMDSVTVDQDTCATCPATCASCPATCNASCGGTCGATCATCPVSCACPSADGRC